ncbi:MAG: transpeptidase family protein [Chitinophagaceae bacterium]|nr:transpeptidase family protein [Chitinophagaceae bacterium]
MEVKRDILWRVYLSFLIIIMISIIIIGKAAYIQQFEGAYWRSKSDSLHQKVVQLVAERGTIYSEDGSMLSTSIPYFDVYIDFGADGLREKNGKRFSDNVDSLSHHLAAFFKDQDKAAYKKQLQKGYKSRNRYYSLKKKLSFDQYKTVRNFPLIRQGRNKSGFIAEVKSTRLNPFGLLANRTIGLARTNAQNVGLERTYDDLLRGEDGRKLVRFIAGGVSVPIEGYEIEPENGRDIITTLDVNIQDIAENSLLKVMTENECEQGTCIVMEVATGKVKAIANLGRRADGTYWEDLNYAIRASEPGSTFKLASMLSVLEDKHVTIQDRVNLEGGKWKIGRRTVYDSEHHGKYDVTIKEAFAESSNVGMAKLVSTYYTKNPDGFIRHLRKLHFDKISDVGVVGETSPIIKTTASKTWSATTLPWMAFGYEVLVSPMQILMLYNAVANNGTMMKPYLVSSIQKNGITIKENEPIVVEEQICTKETLKQLRESLEGVMTEGTGKTLQNPFYTIAGKTGTALVANGKRGYADHIYQSSFAGYFPADHPKYSCIVVIKNKPNAKKFYGAAVAGPVFKEIADKLYALNIQNNTVLKRALNLKKDSTGFFYSGEVNDVKYVMNTLNVSYKDSSANDGWSSLYSSNFQPVVNTRMMEKKVVPNLTGMGLKDALYLLENMGLRVAVKGKGKVASQSLDTGSRFSKGDILIIQLN